MTTTIPEINICATIAKMSPIVDAHVHVGPWGYKPLRTVLTGLGDYHDSADAINPIVFASDLKDQEAIIEGSQMFAFWYDPHSHKINDIPFEAPYMVAIKVHPGIDRVMGGIAAPEYKSMLDRAYAKDIPVIVHCGGWVKTSSPHFLYQVAQDRPEQRFVMAHCGGGNDRQQWESLEYFSDCKYVWADTSSVKYPYIIKKAVLELGPNRVLFGSDWPICSVKSMMYVIKDSGIPLEVQNLILHANAMELFDLSVEVDLPVNPQITVVPRKVVEYE